MAHEVNSGLQWIYDRLIADSEITTLIGKRVYQSIVPQRTPAVTPPYIIYAYQAGQDALTATAVRYMTNAVYQIKAVGYFDGMTVILQLANAIDRLFGDTTSPGTASGGYIPYSYRESPLQYEEEVNSKVWTNLGGLYRLNIQRITS